jgi:hypothetical protein
MAGSIETARFDDKSFYDKHAAALRNGIGSTNHADRGIATWSRGFDFYFPSKFHVELSILDQKLLGKLTMSRRLGEGVLSIPVITDSGYDILRHIALHNAQILGNTKDPGELLRELGMEPGQNLGDYEGKVTQTRTDYSIELSRYLAGQLSEEWRGQSEFFDIGTYQNGMALSAFGFAKNLSHQTGNLQLSPRTPQALFLE